MDRPTTLAVMGGGIVGATIRWSVAELIGPTDGWPWAVFVVNLAGCALLGWLMARQALLSPHRFAGAAVGFCGALTTFSTVAVDLAVMARADRTALFSSYLVVSFAAGIATYLVGRRLGAGPVARQAPT